MSRKLLGYRRSQGLVSFGVRDTDLKQIMHAIMSGQKDLKERLRKTVEKYANSVRNEAIDRVPTDLGRLKTSIYVWRVTNFAMEVIAPVEYAPYIEFGTGDYAKNYLNSIADPELSFYAMQFYKTGKGRMPAQPYLYPSLRNAEKGFYFEVINDINNSFRNPDTLKDK